jgi:short-subunit dehydrogenase
VKQGVWVHNSYPIFVEVVVKINQQHLEAVHDGIREKTQLWVDGLITDLEYTNALSLVSNEFAKYEIAGLIDPATGLRYD